MNTARNKYPAPMASNKVPSDYRRVSGESGKKSRKLWWSPKRNEIEIRSEQETHYKNITSKVDSLSNVDYRPGGGQVSIRDERKHWEASPKVNSLSNVTWLPPQPNVSVRSEKLHWNAHPKVDSLANIDYKPNGGENVAIRDERLDFHHVGPRVDCGFVD